MPPCFLAGTIHCLRCLTRKWDLSRKLNAMKHRRMTWMLAAVSIVFVSFCSLGILWRASGDLSKLGAFYRSKKSDTGIPGLSTWYEAILVNHGKMPVRVQVCDFLDDSGAPGTMIAYSVEQFDSVNGQWRLATDASEAQACHPYPLGWVRTRLKTIWLWPGRELSTGEEITAARGFHRGDSARFVLYPAFRNSSEPRGHGFATPPFTIDEEILGNPDGYRVKH